MSTVRHRLTNVPFCCPNGIEIRFQPRSDIRGSRFQGQPPTHSDGLGDRQIAGEALPWPVLEREPDCFQAAPASFPDDFGGRLAAIIHYGPRLLLKFAQPSYDCLHQRLVFNGRGASEVAALAGIFVGGLPGSNRSELVTLPSASRKLINTERSSSTDGARASSRSNRRDRFLVVIFVSLRHD
jgi:hypothetical protein